MKRMKSNSEFLKEVKDRVGTEYTFLEPYKGCTTKIKVKHNKCGTVYTVLPPNFLRGKRCPKCQQAISNKKRTRSPQQFLKEVYELVGTEYTVLTPYVKARKKVKIKHEVCGSIYEVTPAHFLSGRKCPRCHINQLAIDRTKTQHEFEKEVYSILGKDYKVLSSYKGYKQTIIMKHLVCGNTYYTTPESITTNHTNCAYCNQSIGEHQVTLILKRNHIEFEIQKGFKDLKDLAPLTYDFYIPTKKTLIEYQGRQHYMPVTAFGGETTFKIQQRHDYIKRKYAQENNFNLLEIPYTAKTQQQIKKYLVKNNIL